MSEQEETVDKLEGMVSMADIRQLEIEKPTVDNLNNNIKVEDGVSLYEENYVVNGWRRDNSSDVGSVTDKNSTMNNFKTRNSSMILTQQGNMYKSTSGA